jgi:hypothetical protein
MPTNRPATSRQPTSRPKKCRLLKTRPVRADPFSFCTIKSIKVNQSQSKSIKVKVNMSLEELFQLPAPTSGSLHGDYAVVRFSQKLLQRDESKQSEGVFDLSKPAPQEDAFGAQRREIVQDAPPALTLKGSMQGHNHQPIGGRAGGVQSQNR